MRHSVEQRKKSFYGIEHKEISRQGRGQQMVAAIDTMNNIIFLFPGDKSKKKCASHSKGTGREECIASIEI